MHVASLKRSVVPPAPSGELFLPICDSLSYLHYMDSKGGAVWPAGDRGTYAALANTAALFGASLREVKQVFTGNHQNILDESVVAVGAAYWPIASLYAHLTRRRYTYLNSPEELLRSSIRPTVLVIPTSGITQELLDYLYARSDKLGAPGIICGSDKEVVLRTALCHAAAAQLCVNAPLAEPVCIAPNHEFPPHGPSEQLLDRKSTASEIRHALARGGSLMMITTHSDGTDMFLGEEISLCPLDRSPTGLAGQNGPTCALTGHCYRHKMPVEQALVGGRLVAPERVSSRLLILNVCRGLRLQGGPVDSSWGFWARLHNSDRQGGVIIPWDKGYDYSVAVTSLYLALANGTTAGQALADYNRRPDVARTGAFLALLGDPRLQAPTRADGSVLSVLGRRTRGMNVFEHEQDDSAAQCRLLRAYVARLGPLPTSEGDAMRHALDCIDQYELSAWAGAPLERPSGPGQWLRSALLHAMMLKDEPLYQSWFPVAYLVKHRRSQGKCNSCGNAIRHMTGRFAFSGLRPRTAICCPVCGVIVDAPVGVKLEMNIEHPATVVVSGIPAERHWMGSILVSRRYPGEDERFAWPSAPEGVPADRIVLPRRFSPGVIRISIFFMWSTSVATATQMTRDFQDICSAEGPETQLTEKTNDVDSDR